MKGWHKQTGGKRRKRVDEKPMEPMVDTCNKLTNWNKENMIRKKMGLTQQTVVKPIEPATLELVMTRTIYEYELHSDLDGTNLVTVEYDPDGEDFPVVLDKNGEVIEISESDMMYLEAYITDELGSDDREKEDMA